jgi:hypothetical protein
MSTWVLWIVSICFNLQPAWSLPNLSQLDPIFKREIIETTLFLNELQTRFQTFGSSEEIEKEVTSFLGKLTYQDRLELLFVGVRFPCLIDMKNWEVASEWSSKIVHLFPKARPFFRSVFNIVMHQAPLERRHLVDLKESLEKWDGTFVSSVPAFFESVMWRVSLM